MRSTKILYFQFFLKKNLVIIMKLLLIYHTFQNYKHMVTHLPACLKTVGSRALFVCLFSNFGRIELASMNTNSMKLVIMVLQLYIMLIFNYY